MSVASSLSLQKRPRKTWWLIGAVIFVVCVMVQTPAAWIVQKYAPNSPYLQHISGNIWQGSAIWQLPQAQSGLTGTINWHWKPWRLIVGQLGAEVTVTTPDQTRLVGDVNIKRGGWSVTELSGKISHATLSQVVNWRLPDAPIQVNGLSLDKDEKRGFVAADGQLTWIGGDLGYPSGNKTYQISLPAMHAEFSAEQKKQQYLLHANLLDNQDKRLGDLYLDRELMLDVNLTQRLLENMSEYKGQAPKDTSVVSVRQPLLSGLGER